MRPKIAYNTLEIIPGIEFVCVCAIRYTTATTTFDHEAPKPTASR